VTLDEPELVRETRIALKIRSLPDRGRERRALLLGVVIALPFFSDGAKCAGD
jgi:hypothetical protein